MKPNNVYICIINGLFNCNLYVSSRPIIMPVITHTRGLYAVLCAGNMLLCPFKLNFFTCMAAPVVHRQLIIVHMIFRYFANYDCVSAADTV